jgi:predicted metal-dependent hydrolase
MSASVHLLLRALITHFWRLLETAQPGWQEQARWLRQHGQELHDYDPGRVLPT